MSTMTIRSQIPTETSPAVAAPSAVPAQSTAAPDPEPAPGSQEEEHDLEHQGQGQGKDRHDDHDRDTPKFPHPKLRLEIRDLNHPGTIKFLGAVNASTLLSDAVKNVQRLLYRSAVDKHTTCPPTRSVTVILRDMGGVAYTTGVRWYFLGF